MSFPYANIVAEALFLDFKNPSNLALASLTLIGFIILLKPIISVDGTFVNPVRNGEKKNLS